MKQAITIKLFLLILIVFVLASVSIAKMNFDSSLSEWSPFTNFSETTNSNLETDKSSNFDFFFAQGCQTFTYSPNSGDADYFFSHSFPNLTDANIDNGTGWAAGNSPALPNQNIGVMIDNPSRLISITTKGKGDQSIWTTTYRLQGTKDGSSWVDIPSTAAGGAYPGNTDRNTPVTNTINSTATDWVGVRIIPLTAAGGRAALRFQVTYETCKECPVVKPTDPDTDGDGVPDSVDVDDDNDGIPDCFEKTESSFRVNAQALNGTSSIAFVNNVSQSFNNVNDIPGFNIKATSLLQNAGNATSSTVTVTEFFNASFVNGGAGTNRDGWEIEFTGVVLPVSVKVYTDNNLFAREIAGGNRFSEESIIKITPFGRVTNTETRIIDPSPSHGFRIQGAGTNRNNYIALRLRSFDATNSGGFSSTWKAADNCSSNRIKKINYEHGNNTYTFVDPGKTYQQIYLDVKVLVDRDTDGDGIPNHRDLDSDNDGIPDAIEGCIGVTYEMLDEFCRLPVDLESISFQGCLTGLTQNPCESPLNTDEISESDDEKLPDFLDTDSDNDGCSDSAEAFGFNTIGTNNNSNNNYDSTIAVLENGLTESVGCSAISTGEDWRDDQKSSNCNMLIKNDINQTPQGITTSGNLLTNDIGSHPIQVKTIGFPNNEGDFITVTVDPNTGSGDQTIPDIGTINISSNGNYNFSPLPEFTGDDINIKYTVEDSSGQTGFAFLDLDVISPEDIDTEHSPVANDDTNTTDQNVSVSGNLISSNDYDPDSPRGDLFVNSIVLPSDHLIMVNKTSGSGTQSIEGIGTIEVFSNGTYTFIPNTDFVGKVPSIEYELSDPELNTSFGLLDLKVNPDDGTKNSAYANDDSNLGSQGILQTGNLILNDNDPEANSLEILKATSKQGEILIDGITKHVLASGGEFMIDKNGNYNYWPALDFIGTETITYILCDDQKPKACDVGTLYLTASSQEYDFGDLPDSYGIAQNKNSKSDADSGENMPGKVNAVWAGMNVTYETKSIYHETANGDNGDDGVTEFPQTVVRGENYTVKVTVNSNASGKRVYYGLWIDWNGDKDFEDENEFYNGSGITNSPTTVDQVIKVPSSYSGSGVIYRLRVNDQEQSANSFQGLQNNGETEDFNASFLLPVELISFTAEAQNEDVVLEWATATELNSEKFEIQYSLDGVNFETFAEIAGQGTTRETTEYTYTHVGVGSTNVEQAFYRLRQVDFDGTASFSEIRVVVFASVNKLVAYPVPAEKGEQIVITGTEILGNYKVINMRGSVEFDGRANSNSVSISTDSLSSGTYMILFETGEQIQFIIE